ncbi:sulfur carrier protein ThiS [Paracoccus sp. 1_MG-2023]|uniref:sulfur carrier protein ThiS n=1 Tax=unclassified Paracoccus (in: a-proteobacteria) TaxID=2688777 RepID=UPI001C0993FD|nr:MULTISPECIES: sulfur carrier protein ThiS [unclassified Paracoccus (in: a-proteobacteria)]MBU2956570.1 sulfur carrier protein ThiS [Paracoccus sp. C2R09]MDO6668676.1 sulfur carrier protein ThiS [Paracoccus sp. 1_MG-2023]
MRIEVNGEPRDVASATLAAAIKELGWAEARIVTAVNGDFVPLSARATQPLQDGDRIEVLTPMQGG